MLNIGNRLRQSCLGLSIFILTCTIYYQVIDYEFINFDDNVYLTENNIIKSGLSLIGIKWAFTTNLGGHWHPLSWISHMIDVSLFGMNPAWHHIVNIIFHALNSIILFIFILLILESNHIAFFSAVVFAVHPMRLESVAWISERKDVLSMFFGLSTITLFTLSIKLNSKKIYLVSLLTFILSLLAKPTFITIPALLLILDYWPNQRNIFKKKGIILIEKIPFLIISILSGVASILSQISGGGLRTIDQISLTQRLDMAIISYSAYLGKFFWPSGLALFYPQIEYYPGIVSGALLGLIAISIICYIFKSQLPCLTFGWLWFIVALMPLCGFITIGGQAFADRWTYLPHIGLIITSVYTSYSYNSNYKFISFCWLVIIVSLSSMTLNNIGNWRSSETVFRHALKVVPDNFMAHTNLGATLMNASNITEAIQHYEEAIRLNPNFPEALNNLGIVRASQGRIIEAVDLFNQALKIKPDFLIAQQNLQQANYDLLAIRAQR
jgi:protein O-mannosyl-transferase